MTTVASSATEVQLAAADGARSSLALRNTSAYTLYFGYGPSAVTIANAAYALVSGQTATLTPPESHLEVRGIWAQADAGGCVVTEVTEAVTGGNNTIQTYGELKASIAAWLKPNTTLPSDETTNRIPEYVSLFEAEANRRLRVFDMQDTDTSLAVTSGAATIPTGFVNVLSMSQNGEPYRRITRLPIDVMDGLDPTATGEPFYYDRVDRSFVFYPPITTTVSLRYRRGLTALSDDSDTNWLLSEHPDAYLYGALMHGQTRLIDPEALSLIERRYETAMRQIQMLNNEMNLDRIIVQPSGFVV